MAVPTVPTLVTLAAEALKRAGILSPVAALTTRAQDLWIEEIKNDIMRTARGRKLRPLFTSSTTVTVNNKSRYACPPDYFSDLSLEILDGANKGTATDGASGSITLASSVTVEGYNIIVTSGTGVGSMSQCTAFNTSTLVATISPNFTTAPANASTYTIVDTYTPLIMNPIERHRELIGTTIGLPERFYIMGSPSYHEFELDPVPDNGDYVYGIRMSYYANLMTLDLASTLMSTLYQRWRDIWLQGIYYRALREKSDDKYKDELIVYENMLAEMLRSDADGIDNVNTRIKGTYY